MDIDQLYTVKDHDNGAKMTVTDQFGKETDLILTIVGLDSKKWRSLASKLRQIDDDAKDNTEQTAAILSKAVLSWEGATDSKKTPIVYSEKVFIELALNAPYIMSQVTSFIIDRTNFTKG